MANSWWVGARDRVFDDQAPRSGHARSYLLQSFGLQLSDSQYLPVACPGDSAAVLALIALLATVDLLIDLRDGVTGWHVLAEALVAAVACFGAFYLFRGGWELRRRQDVQARDFLTFRQQAIAAARQNRAGAIQRGLREVLPCRSLGVVDFLSGRSASAGAVAGSGNLNSP